MSGDFFTRCAVIGIAWIIVSSAGIIAAPIKVTDVKGRAIEIELVSLVGNSITFRRAGDAREFTLPLATFAVDSQELIRGEAGKMPVVLPKIKPDVVIGKRHRKSNSYYMVEQEISSTVKLTNTSLTVPIPGITGRILYIGEDRRTPRYFQVLSVQDIEASIEPGKTFEKVMESFVTRYDSDNKGYGNIGGSQYTGYILVVSDKDGNVILDHTVTGSFRKAITARPQLLKECLTYAEGRILTDKLIALPIVVR